MLIVLSGVSGSGKNTVITHLLERNNNLRYFKSATTRAPREGENNYHYFTNQEFETRVKNGEFFETEKVHDNYYGIMMKDVNKILEDERCDYIKDVDVHGNQRLRKFFKDKSPILSVFLDAPDYVLRDRLLKRGESEERVEVRLSRASMERAHKADYDLVIENLDLEKTITIIG